MSEQYLSEIRIFSFGFAPKGWAFCNGQTLAISQYNALFALIGTTYGGNGITTFQLPNLQGCVPLHMGTNPTDLNTYTIGQQAGETNVTLNINQIASHSHTVNANSGSDASVPSASVVPGGGNVTAYGTSPGAVTMNNGIVGQTGGNQPHSNLQPYLVLNFCIATAGIFPSRN
jgi:microcystin-dependent protein